MKVRLLAILERIGFSFWFIPGVLTACALVAGVIMPRIDRAFGGDLPNSLPWIYSGGAEGARTLLATVAGSMIGLAGVAFSITIVTLVLAASQFGPRLLRNFMRDKSIQLVLGAFLATFLYCLLVLREVNGVDEESVFVPHLSITCAIALTTLSLALLIYFFHHVAQGIQAPHVIAGVNRDLVQAIDQLFPDELADELPDSTQPAAAFDLDRVPSAEVRSASAGYIHRFDYKALLAIAEERDLVLRVDRRAGQYVNGGDGIFEVWPADRLDDKLAARLASTYELGRSRTLSQDAAFALDQLEEVAVRALSPGINDPFTAMQCLDWLGDALIRLAERRIPDPWQVDENGRVRVLTYPLGFGSLADAAFNMIRQNARGQVAVQLRLLETIGRVLERARRPEDRSSLLNHARVIHDEARASITSSIDVDDLEKRFATVTRAAPGAS